MIINSHAKTIHYATNVARLDPPPCFQQIN
jgi:hypothetical protein